MKKVARIGNNKKNFATIGFDQNTLGTIGSKNFYQDQIL